MKNMRNRCALMVAAMATIGGAGIPLGRADGQATAWKQSPRGKALGWDGTVLVQLHVSDLERSIQFYRDVLGFALYEQIPDLNWAKLHSPVLNVEIGLGAGTGGKDSGGMSLNFGVADIEKARAELESRGVTFDGPTITIPNVVKLADFTDPDGNRIRLAQGLPGDVP